jgi:signal transduction histidine kinase
MKRPATRLMAQLMGIRLLACTSAVLLVLAFAPRLLLLDPRVVEGSRPLALAWWVAIVVVVVAATVLASRSVRALLRGLSVGGIVVAPEQVVALSWTPARLVATDLASSFCLGAATLLPQLRPETNDLPTQVELVLLALTMTSVAALPAYVALRAAVARAMELVPPVLSREALERLESRGRVQSGLRLRLLAAVVAPVAFVALGASLLVQAHLRAYDTAWREDDARVLASALDAIDGDPRGRRAAIDAAKALGFEVAISRAPASPGKVAAEDGRTMLSVPLSDGHAEVTFDAGTIGGADACVAIASAAILLAALVGRRIGTAFGNDLVLATRELDRTGVADVLRGWSIREAPRFASVADLLKVTGRMGGVFREFARAQQRSIDARASTERMRGLFLASMSHDLKAPLNAILGFAELVSRGELTEGQRESVNIIEQRGRELLYLIDTILDAARLEARELTVAPEPTRVGDVVMSAIADARELASGMEVAISGEIQPGVPSILADAPRLSQALTAIILVASRFGEKGEVVVRAALPATAGAELRIDVELITPRASSGDREKIVDAFKNPEGARRHGGLGLGPALARAIVELHGGKVEIETMEAGVTVVHVWVPTARPSRA